MIKGTNLLQQMINHHMEPAIYQQLQGALRENLRYWLTSRNDCSWLEAALAEQQLAGVVLVDLVVAYMNYKIAVAETVPFPRGFLRHVSFQGDDIPAFLLLKQHCSDDSEHSLREHVFLGRDVLKRNKNVRSYL